MKDEDKELCIRETVSVKAAAACDAQARLAAAKAETTAAVPVAAVAAAWGPRG